MSEIKKMSGTTNIEETALEKKGRALARKAATAGIVLLKNEGQLLPLTAGKKIALYGCGAEYTVKGGTGSGDVNERYSVNILDGLKNAGLDITSWTWLTDFRNTYEKERLAWKEDILSRVHPDVPGQDFFGIYSTTPFQIPGGREITEADYQEADTDTAIYVISRIAGEGKDRSNGAGDWKLSKEEERNIHSVAKWFAHVILIVNAGGMIDLSILDQVPEIHAVVYLSQAGMEGGNALGLLLTGAVTPSGKLTDSWAFQYEDYPNAATFSYHSGDITTEEYTEGIYVGYRYFDTFDVPVRYPFGYGLSYTDFSIELTELVQEQGKNIVRVEVENTGNHAGAEVVQVYISCPQPVENANAEKKHPAYSKEKRRLCGFAKTKVLEPGKRQSVEISFSIRQMASFDEVRHAYVLDAGKYGVWVGNALNTAKPVGVIAVMQERIIKQVAPICPLSRELQEITPDAQKLSAWERQWQEETKGFTELLLDLSWADSTLESQKIQQSNSLSVHENSPLEEEILSRMTIKQKISLLAGRTKEGAGSNLGSAGHMVPGSAGETVAFETEKESVHGIVLADGPAGLRLAQSYEVDENGCPKEKDIAECIEKGLFSDEQKKSSGTVYYQFCTAMPVGTLLAQTWDESLLKEVGCHVGMEMDAFHVTLWLAPGMNIHRNPLCGRNFEYYSEDPLLSGRLASAMTAGVQSIPGVGTTIKHFACNNQEDNRVGSDSIISERALREIYLFGFEIAVMQSQPMAIMTSYNLINGIHAANSFDLCTETARREWGFQGLIMTDWFTTSPGGGSSPWRCVKAGNDLIMPGDKNDLQDIEEAYERNDLTEAEIDTCVRHILHIVLQAQ